MKEMNESEWIAEKEYSEYVKVLRDHFYDKYTLREEDIEEDIVISFKPVKSYKATIVIHGEGEE